jgi:hypothetical protein
MATGITVTSNPDPEQLESLGVTSWPTWGCGVSTFPWSYDEQETCLLLEGATSASCLPPLLNVDPQRPAGLKGFADTSAPAFPG